jgi:RNA polymerase sigma factor (sigma-70 family)
VDPTDSCTKILERLRQRDDLAETELFRRYTARLIGLAASHLGERLRRKVDPDDVVQSVLWSFYRRQRAGEFEIKSWDNLWNLLAKITIAKCANRAQHFATGRRDVERELHAAGSESGDPLDQILAREPDPDGSVILAETIERLLGVFDPIEQQALTMMLEDYSIADISARLGPSESTFKRLRRRAERRLLNVLEQDERL